MSFTLPCEIHDYTFVSLINCGSFASVYKATHNPTRRNVAIKTFAKEKILGEQQLEILKNEVNIFRRADSPLIAYFFECFENEEFFFVSMELVENDSLLSYINACGGINEGLSRRIFSQIVIVLSYIHNTMNVVHRDIKAENILLDKLSNIRLIDFGFSKIFHGRDEKMMTMCGSLLYAAPEIIKGGPYGSAIDVWSIGVLLYTMISGTQPFYSINTKVMVDQILSEEPDYSQKFSPPVIDLLKKMLTKDPHKRITIDQLMIHPWVSQAHINPEKAMDLKVIWPGKMDHSVIMQMIELGLDTSTLAETLFDDVTSKETVSYKILRRHLIPALFNEAFSIQKTHRNSSVTTLDSLKPLHPPDSILMSPNFPNNITIDVESHTTPILANHTFSKASPLGIRDSPNTHKPTRTRMRSLTLIKRGSSAKIVIPPVIKKTFP